ncbi:MAG: ferritin [Gemmatimonadetes bacterium RBG_16_66_8]|nr:MAG: ferritin [Gemmatimonadetes bacterium RBG_16_66_8]
MQDALNDQIQREFHSAYTYLSMSAYCSAENLPGFATWMRLQAQEEAGHAMRIFDYVDDRTGRIALQAIEQPPAQFKSVLEVVQRVKKHEESVTGSINRLYALAQTENDYATQTFLHWFITEQVEEEKTTTALVERLKMAGDNKSAVLLLDREVGARSAAD